MFVHSHMVCLFVYTPISFQTVTGHVYMFISVRVTEYTDNRMTIGLVSGVCVLFVLLVVAGIVIAKFYWFVYSVSSHINLDLICCLLRFTQIIKCTHVHYVCVLRIVFAKEISVVCLLCC